MKIISLSLLFILFLFATAAVYLYLFWGTRRLLHSSYDEEFADSKRDLIIDRCGRILCTVYAPLCILLLIYIFV